MTQTTLKPIGSSCEFAATETPAYSGYPWWVGLIVECNREVQSAERLERARVDVYLPQFSRVVSSRMSGRSQRRLYALLPGLIFMPEEFLAIRDRDRVFEWARVHGFMRGAGTPVYRLAKCDIERLRQMEAEMNLPQTAVPAANGKAVAVGAPIRFLKGLWAWLGEGVVIEIVSRSRIGVEVPLLFGARRKVYVPAREIEVM